MGLLERVLGGSGGVQPKDRGTQLLDQQRDGTLDVAGRRELNLASAQRNPNFARLSKGGALKPAEQAWLTEMKAGNGPRAAALAAQDAGGWGAKPLSEDEKVELKTLRAGLGDDAARYAVMFRNANQNPEKYPVSPSEQARGQALLDGKTRREADARATAVASATIRGQQPPAMNANPASAAPQNEAPGRQGWLKPRG